MMIICTLLIGMHKIEQSLNLGRVREDNFGLVEVDQAFSVVVDHVGAGLITPKPVAALHIVQVFTIAAPAHSQDGQLLLI